MQSSEFCQSQLSSHIIGRARRGLDGETAFRLSIAASCFKTGMEPGLICYECVGTHPGCGLTDFDSRWYWGKICPRSDDRCVKVGLTGTALKMIKIVVKQD